MHEQICIQTLRSLEVHDEINKMFIRPRTIGLLKKMRGTKFKIVKLFVEAYIENK